MRDGDGHVAVVGLQPGRGGRGHARATDGSELRTTLLTTVRRFWHGGAHTVGQNIDGVSSGPPIASIKDLTYSLPCALWHAGGSGCSSQAAHSSGCSSSIYKGGASIYKGGSSIYKGGSSIFKGGSSIYKGGSSIYKGGRPRTAWRARPSGSAARPPGSLCPRGRRRAGPGRRCAPPLPSSAQLGQY